MTTHPLYIVTYTGKARLYRRRYAMALCQAADGKQLMCHNARILLPEVVDDPIVETNGFKHTAFVHSAGTAEEAADGRWPTKCAVCGYVFVDGDEWQIGTDPIYRREDTGQEGPLSEFPPGALWEGFWLQDFHKGDDGKCWVVKLPDGVAWAIDGLSRDGKPWTRTGTAPKLTARPSILTPGYHGFLTDGVLVSC